MGKLRSFYVELLDPQQVYFAGQTITGRLVVELDAEMKMRGAGLCPLDGATQHRKRKEQTNHNEAL